MRIAFTTSGNDLEAPVDRRFGRAPNFLIYDSDTGTFDVISNEQNLNAAQGAGIQSAMHLANEHVDSIVTGNCGPKAYATLDAAGIEIYTCGDVTIREAIEQLKNGRLTKAQQANVEAHWV